MTKNVTPHLMSQKNQVSDFGNSSMELKLFHEIAEWQSVDRQSYFSKDLSGLSKVEFIQKRVEAFVVLRSAGEMLFSTKKDNFILGFVRHNKFLFIAGIVLGNPLLVRDMLYDTRHFIEEKGIDLVTSVVYRGNERSLKFHKRLGFEIDFERSLGKENYFQYVKSSTLLAKIPTP